MELSLEGILSPLDNKLVSSVLSFILVLYAGLVAPKLPENVAKILDNPAAKFIVFFLLAFLSYKDPSVALIATIGVMITFQTISRYQMNNEMDKVLENEDKKDDEVEINVVQEENSVDTVVEE